MVDGKTVWTVSREPGVKRLTIWLRPMLSSFRLTRPPIAEGSDVSLLLPRTSQHPSSQPRHSRRLKKVRFDTSKRAVGTLTISFSLCDTHLYSRFPPAMISMSLAEVVAPGPPRCMAPVLLRSQDVFLLPSVPNGDADGNIGREGVAKGARDMAMLSGSPVSLVSVRVGEANNVPPTARPLEAWSNGRRCSCGLLRGPADAGADIVREKDRALAER
jgi:hypothetical protein